MTHKSLRLLLAIAVVLVAVTFWFTLTTRAERGDKGKSEKRQATQEVPATPVAVSAAAFGITPPLRETKQFRGLEPQYTEFKIKESNNEFEDPIHPRNRRPASADAPFIDPLVGKSNLESNAPAAMPGPALTFEGLSGSDNATVTGGLTMPPDTVGDVGPNHYVQTTNVLLRIFNKSGTPLGSAVQTNALFAGLPAGDVCRVNNDGDPIVLYDPLADRWLISQFAFNEAVTPAVYRQCIAISQTPDPTGAYYTYSFNMGTVFNDYPHFGVWPDAYYMTDNQFTTAGTFTGAGVWAFDRSKMLTGDPAATAIYVNRPSNGGMLPTDLDGYMPPPAGVPQTIFQFDADEQGGTDSLLAFDFVPNFTTPGSSTFTAKPTLPVAAFDADSPGTSIEQSTGATLDDLADRLMNRVGYRNLGTLASPTHSFVLNWTVNVSSGAGTTAVTYTGGSRWEELRRSAAGNLSIFDQGTHAPGSVTDGITGTNRWMGSIAQDNNGNLALGFSRASTTQNADIVWAGRTGGQVAAGTMNEGEAVMFASTGVQSSGSRWGDYSAMSVDPNDDCTFWYTTEYRASTENGTTSNNNFRWRTRVGNFKFPSCTNAPKGQIAVHVTDCGSGLPISGATVTMPVGFQRTTNASGDLLSNIIAPPDNYTVTASKSGFPANTGNATITNGNTTSISICLTGTPMIAAATNALVSESCATPNNAIDPGETVTVALALQNNGSANATNVVGALQKTGGVTGTFGTRNYGTVNGNGGTGTQNFTFTVDPNQACGSTVTVTLALTSGGSALGNVTYSLPIGVTSAGSATTQSFTTTAVIPDNNTAGINVTFAVSGITGTINDLDFRFDGTVSSATVGATTVGVTHSWIGDLQFKLTSPAATTATIVSQPGGANCSSNNIYQLRLDDESANNVTCPGTTSTGPLTGTLKPANSLSVFDGQSPNGTWTLNAADLAAGDTGTVRAFSIIITPTAASCCAPRKWTGAVSSDWNNAANWSPNGVPAASETAWIPATGVTNEPNISAASVTVTGLLVDTGRTLTVTSPRTLTVTGSSVINGTVNVTGGVTLPTNSDLGSSTFNYSGATAQTLPSLTYNNLTVNNAAGATLGGNTTVGNTLTLTNGVLDTGVNTLTVSSCTAAAVAGGSAGSYVKGSLQRCLTAGSTYAFPVGTASDYSPVSVAATTGTTNFTVNPVIGPVTGSLITSLNRTWTLTSTATPGAFVGNVSFTYTANDLTGYTGALPIDRAVRNNGSGSFTSFTGTLAGTTLTVNGLSSFSPWGLGGANAPTLARVEKFNGYHFAEGNLVRWQSSLETQNLGFRIYRQEGKNRVLLTPELLAGSAFKFGANTLLTAGNSYSWWDEGGRAGSVYWIEDINLQGRRTMHGPVSSAECGVNDAECNSVAALRPQSSPTLNQAGAADTSGRFITGYPARQPAGPVSAVAAAGSDAWAQQLRLAANPAALKINVRREGWQRAAAAQLQAAGLPAQADARFLQLYAEGVQVPLNIRTAQGGDSGALGADGIIEFYGTGLDTRASDTRVYWLIVGDTPGLRFGKPGQAAPGGGGDVENAHTVSVRRQNAHGGTRRKQKSPDTAPVAGNNFAYTVERRDRTIYAPGIRNGDADNFFGAVISSTASGQTVRLNGIDMSSPAMAQVEVAVQGGTDDAHRVNVEFNGQTLGVLEFAGPEAKLARFQVPQNALREGDNTFSLRALNGPGDVSVTQYLRVTYARRYEAEDNYLRFTTGHRQGLTVNGFTSPAVRVFDVTVPGRYFQVAARAASTAAGYAVTVSGNLNNRTLLAVADEQALTPAGIMANTASEWTSAEQSADFVIIAPREFIPAVQPLADLRRGQGLRTEVINVEDIYDEWNGGVKSASALRSFLAWTRTHWAAAPRYVLLAGDASYDPRDYLGFGATDIVPTALPETSQLETSSDEALVDFNGDNIGEMSIGRLPVRTAEQAATIIGKIVNYRPSEGGAVFVADRPQGADFAALNQTARNLLPAGLAVTNINRAGQDDDAMRRQIVNAINAGPSLVQYAGHGSLEVWTGAGVLNPEAIAGLTNGSRLPLFVTMTCLNGYFHDLHTESLAERLLRAPNGGGIAVWASSGLTLTPAQAPMDRELFRLLYQNGASPRLGDAVRQAKAATGDSEVRLTWILFGDPTLIVR